MSRLRSLAHAIDLGAGRATRTPRADGSAGGWLTSVVKPNLAPLTYVAYEGAARLYIVPRLGPKRLDKLTVRDVRE
ncbi:hypothetical protein [Streptomyces sp. AA1529]|uniref:hypothetical protein n=1 Tax=Streptomyces sp. AA1529 TaxID=1203257 RepID=UPI003D755080